MKPEPMPSKMPEGYSAHGLPIDSSLPTSYFGVRIGLNLTIVIDAPANQLTKFTSAIVWNTETGERVKIFLEGPRPMLTPLPAASGTFMSGLDISKTWLK